MLAPIPAVILGSCGWERGVEAIVFQGTSLLTAYAFCKLS